MSNIQELIQRRNTVFIENRTMIKHQIDAFMVGVANIKPEYLAGVQKPNGTITEEILPELWHEPFNKEVYQQQLNTFLAFHQQVLNIANNVNQKALEYLSQQ